MGGVVGGGVCGYGFWYLRSSIYIQHICISLISSDCNLMMAAIEGRNIQFTQPDHILANIPQLCFASLLHFMIFVSHNGDVSPQSSYNSFPLFHDIHLVNVILVYIYIYIYIYPMYLFQIYIYIYIYILNQTKHLL